MGVVELESQRSFDSQTDAPGHHSRKGAHGRLNVTRYSDCYADDRLWPEAMNRLRFPTSICPAHSSSLAHFLQALFSRLLSLVRHIRILGRTIGELSVIGPISRGCHSSRLESTGHILRVLVPAILLDVASVEFLLENLLGMLL